MLAEGGVSMNAGRQQSASTSSIRSRSVCAFTRDQNIRVRASSLPADVVKRRAGAFGFEHLGRRQRVGIGDLAVLLAGYLRGGHAQAKKTRIHAVEGFLHRGVIHEILVYK